MSSEKLLFQEFVLVAKVFVLRISKKSKKFFLKAANLRAAGGYRTQSKLSWDSHMASLHDVFNVHMVVSLQTSW